MDKTPSQSPKVYQANKSREEKIRKHSSEEIDANKRERRVEPVTIVRRGREGNYLVESPSQTANNSAEQDY